MRLVRWPGPDGATVVGRLTDDGHQTLAVPVAGTVADVARQATRQPGWEAPAAGEPLPLSALDLLAPVDPPPSVRDFYAFERHVATARRGRGLEMDPRWYERPVFYFSNPAVLLGPDDDVTPPPRTAALDFELELAWVVGEDVAGADLAAAARAVVGYTIMNDWSARDVQRDEMALSLGPTKGKDFATSLGPWLVTADEFDPSSGRMQAWVNGVAYSDADLGECWWSAAEMVSHAAEGTRVRAGDVFGSGTCGTGCVLELSLTHGADRYPWLQPGDLVELAIEGLGRLGSRVAPVAAGAWTSDPDREGNRR